MSSNQNLPDHASMPNGLNPAGVPQILETLRDLESQLDGIRRMQAEVEARESKLRAHRQRLKKVHAELQRRKASAVEREQALEAREQSLESYDNDVRTREQSLVDTESSIEERQRRIDELEATLRDAEEDLERRRMDVTASEESLRESQASIDEARAAVSNEADERNASIEHEASAIQQQRDELEQRREAFEAGMQEREEQLREQAAAVNEQRDTLDKADAELQERSADLQRQQEELQHSLKWLDEEQRSLDAQRENASAETDERSASLAAELAEAQNQLKELTARCASQETRLEEQTRALQEQPAATGDDALDELVAENEVLREQLVEERRRTAESAAELEEREEAVLKRSERVTDLEREIANLRESISTSPGNSQASIAKAKEESASAIKRADRAEHELERVTKRLERASERVETLEHELNDATQSPPSLEKYEQAIKALRSKLASVQEENASLGGSGGASGPDPALRRVRLQRYKRLLQGETQKLIQAQEGIRRRRAECEKLLKQRSKVQKAAQDIRRREKRLATSKSRTGAFGSVCYLVVTLGILAALSWAISFEVSPGMYVAQAAIEADQSTRILEDGQLSDWQEYHERLITDDPQLMELVAERMESRGIEELATPGDVLARMKDDLWVESSHDGMIALELRGEGPQRTQRELETYVMTLVSRANSTRAQRGDAPVTIVGQQPKASSSPVDDTRLKMAGMILGGSALAALLFGTVVWGRLSRSKDNFDRQQAAEAALDDADWSLPDV